MLLLLLSLIVVPHFQKSESDGVCVYVYSSSLWELELESGSSVVFFQYQTCRQTALIYHIYF